MGPIHPEGPSLLSREFACTLSMSACPQVLSQHHGPQISLPRARCPPVRTAGSTEPAANSPSGSVPTAEAALQSVPPRRRSPLWGQREMGSEGHSSSMQGNPNKPGFIRPIRWASASAQSCLLSCLIPPTSRIPTPSQHRFQRPQPEARVTHKVQFVSQSSLRHLPTFKDKGGKSEASSSKYLSLSHCLYSCCYDHKQVLNRN